ncbi:unnamed protein product [Polarella glacialis]|uniref:MORN repeat-containing protein 5 n=1 Tax=Polarella glacialis TaxID=89957 RepID=A0A813IG24_POLGL|nr:unnamed protein product [Polarella glacialis]
MGQGACSTQCPSTCHNKNGTCLGSDMLSEYEPKASTEVHGESLEMPPPLAVALKEDHSPQEGGFFFASAADEGAADSYFARELEELQGLKAGGRNGARLLYTFKTGATYKGQWKGNARHGVGEQEWPDGAKFIGTWKDNCAEGTGQFVHADGDIFVGQWRRSAAEGLGSEMKRFNA